ncbi:MAG: hypothetical protein AAF633_08015 [Chloroflexota bacterium]
MTQHPLSETIAQLKEIVDYVEAQVGVPDGSGWISPSELFGPESAVIPQLRSHFETCLKTTSKNMLGSAIIQAYQRQLIVTVIGTYLAASRVPDLSHSNFSLRLFTQDNAREEVGEVGVEKIAFLGGRFYALPDDPAASHPDITLISDAAALRDRLRAELVTHFNSIVSQIGSHIGTKPRGLWLDVADQCAGTLIWLMQETKPGISAAEIKAEIDLLLKVSGSPLNHNKIGHFRTF